MGMMYPWATPEKLLDEMSLDQIIHYHREGWNARKTDAQMFWGVLGEALSGNEKTSKGLDEFRKSHPEGIVKDGAWTVSR